MHGDTGPADLNEPQAKANSNPVISRCLRENSTPIRTLNSNR